MTNDDDVNHWVKLINKGHGYAGIFNYSTNQEDKRIVERGAVEEWRKAAEAMFGISIKHPLANVSDPPDFFVNIRDKRLSVELVQLVEPEHKSRAARGESPYHGQLFLDMQWSKERLIQKIKSTISGKGEKYKKQGIEIDVLLIYTGEPWLAFGQAQKWLHQSRIVQPSNIHAAHLLFEYKPGRESDDWPLICIYGDFPD